LTFFGDSQCLKTLAVAKKIIEKHLMLYHNNFKRKSHFMFIVDSALLLTAVGKQKPKTNFK